MDKNPQRLNSIGSKIKTGKNLPTLVIVESPSKANTIKKYLGKNYFVEASFGHVIDLPKSRMAVDVSRNFKPEYITIRGKANIIKNLLNLAKNVKNILLATDPDREGEAIAWHLSNVLKKANPDIQRIMFNEITKNAVMESVNHPRKIDLNLVNSQQARRVLDRLVGYSISPLLWKRIKKGLSAGRVQSVVLKWICAREKEIEEFISEEYWELDTDTLTEKNKKLSFSLDKINNEKIKINNQNEMAKILNEFGCSLIDCSIVDTVPPKYVILISSVKKNKRNRKPPLPFTTSSLQQDAYNKLNFTTKKTMIVAQQLYEGISLGKLGHTGLITYMRTDSIRISPEAASIAKEYINWQFGEKYIGGKIRSQKSKKIQDAHEAIRPANVDLTPEEIEPFLSNEQFKLYNLIWRRFIASFMADEEGEQTSIAGNFQGHDSNYTFKTGGRVVTFPGFASVYTSLKEKKEIINIPSLKEGDLVKMVQLFPKQKFTEPPSRFTESAIVSKLESTGIGRPSTYAPTIDTIQKRYYVLKVDKGLKPTELGKIVAEEMNQYFAYLIDDSFTSELEKKLDKVEEGEVAWETVMEEFYQDFHKTVEIAAENLTDRRESLTEDTGIICEKCGRPMQKKIGRFGYFLACSGFPNCKNTKSIPIGKCPKCDKGFIIIKKSKKRKGKEFYTCDQYPECDFITYEIPKIG